MPSMKDMLERLKREGAALGDVIQNPSIEDRPGIVRKHGLKQPLPEMVAPAIPSGPMGSPAAQPSGNGPLTEEEKALARRRILELQAQSQAAGERFEEELRQRQLAEQEGYEKFPGLKKEFGQ